MSATAQQRFETLAFWRKHGLDTTRGAFSRMSWHNAPHVRFLRLCARCRDIPCPTSTRHLLPKMPILERLFSLTHRTLERNTLARDSLPQHQP